MAQSGDTRHKPTVPAIDGADAFSIGEFCRRHGISVQAYYKYKTQMPVTFRIGKRVLISREAAAAWRRVRETVEKAIPK